MKYKSMQAAFDADDFRETVGIAFELGTPNALIRIKDGTRVGLLHVMVWQDSAPGVKLMLDSGADPDVLSSIGETPLHHAVVLDALEIAKILLAGGADINARRGGTNETPLIMALLGKKRAFARYLIDQGADLDLVDNRGMSPRLIMVSLGD